MAGLFTGLLSAYAGYGKGRADKRQYEEKKRMDDEALKEQQITFQQGQEDRQRSFGIDPATGKPFIMPLPLTQIRPNNKGKGGEPTLQDLHAHETALTNWYIQTGQMDLAKTHAQNAQAYMSQLKSQEAQQAQWMRDVFNQNQQNAREQSRLNDEDRRQMNMLNAEDRRQLRMLQAQNQRELSHEEFQGWLHGQPTYHDLHPTTGASGGAPQIKAAQSEAKWRGDWQKAISGKPAVVQNGVTTRPAIPALISDPRLIADAGRRFSIIDKDKDPIGTAEKLASLERNQTLKRLLIERGVVAAQKRQATLKPLSLGGSDASADPTQSPWP